MKPFRVISALASSLLSGAALAQTTPINFGAMPDNGGGLISGYELADLLDQYIEDGSRGDRTVNSNIAFVGVFCYAGNFIANLNGPTGEAIAGGGAFDRVSFSNTTRVTANGRDLMSYLWGGARDGIIGALAPGATLQAVFDAATSNARSGETSLGGQLIPLDETPGLDGAAFRTLGGTTSTHVLTWAGLTEAVDLVAQQQILDDWITRPNTTVTILSGNQAPSTMSHPNGNTLTRGPATRAALVEALQTIGALMDDGVDEQLVLVLLDHGALLTLNLASQLVPAFSPTTGPGFGSSIVELVDDDVLELRDGLDSMAQQGVLTIGSSVAAPLEAPFIYDVFLNGGYLGSLDEVKYSRIFAGDRGAPGVYEYSLPFGLDLLVPIAEPVDPLQPLHYPQQVEIFNATPLPLPVEYVGLSLGPVAAVPEPGVAAFGVAALATLAAVRLAG